ncbi:MAG TPA: hypothetical protein VGG48_14915 [Rhizomicrobium sp.]|jgi:hypothetical protein
MGVYVWTATGAGGNWTTPGNWDQLREPVGSDTAEFTNSSSAGTSYEADITSAIQISSLEIKNADADVVESSAGSIIVHNDFTVEDGTAELNATNTMSYVSFRDGGLVEFSVAGALGVHKVNFDDGALEGTANVSLANALVIDTTAHIDAAAGDTVKYLGAVTMKGAAIQFGSADLGHGAPDPTGTVEIAGTAFTNSSTGYTIDVTSGTVISGAGSHGVAADGMFSGALEVDVSAGATLDVGHFGTAVTLNDLAGTGTIKDSSDAVVITLAGADFGGTFSGANKLYVASSASDVLSGNLGTATAIATGNNTTLDLTDATGKYSLTSEGAGSVLKLGSGTVNHITGFDSGNLTIDTNFNKHDVVVYKTGSGYEQMVIHPGHGAATISIYFFGLTSSDGIVVGADSNSHMEISYAPAEAHAAAVEHAVAEAAFVPMDHGLF